MHVYIYFYWGSIIEGPTPHNWMFLLIDDLVENTTLMINNKNLSDFTYYFSDKRRQKSMIPKKNPLIVVEEWECGKKVAKNTKEI